MSISGRGRSVTLVSLLSHAHLTHVSLLSHVCPRPCQGEVARLTREVEQLHKQLKEAEKREKKLKADVSAWGWSRGHSLGRQQGGS